MVATSALLAHQGGWDEILIVVGPLLVVVGLMYWARNRQHSADRDAQAADRPAAD